MLYPLILWPGWPWPVLQLKQLAGRGAEKILHPPSGLPREDTPRSWPPYYRLNQFAGSSDCRVAADVVGTLAGGVLGVYLSVFFYCSFIPAGHISENTPWRKRNLRAQSANVYARIPVYASMSGVVSHELTSQRPTSFVDEFGKSTVYGCEFVAFIRVVYFQILGSWFNLMFGTWTDIENIHLALTCNQMSIFFLFLVDYSCYCL